ncbi:MAG TPA: hypothetical protein VGB13_10660 [Candidatus Krumholzibacteria bacterium]
MKPMNGLIAIGMALCALSGTLACHEQGPLENAGEKVDEAVDDITHPGEGPIEEAARKTGEKVDEVHEDITN